MYLQRRKILLVDDEVLRRSLSAVLKLADLNRPEVQASIVEQRGLQTREDATPLQAH